MQRKVLILAYDFPPFTSVGGQRPYSWYRHFREFDVYPVVVTRQWVLRYGDARDYVASGYSEEIETEYTEFGTLVHAPYKPTFSNQFLLKFGQNRFVLFRKTLTVWSELLQYLFFQGPKSKLYYAARSYLQNNKVDVIVATGSPFILFKYADALSRQFNVPWIADYRDPWVQDKTRNKYSPLSLWDACFERKYLKSASVLFTVSDFSQQQIEKTVRGKPFEIIPNGYSEIAQKAAQSVHQAQDIFTISYAGTIYKWHPWKSFLSVLYEFISMKGATQLRVNFYGINNTAEIRNFAAVNYPDLLKFITFHSHIPHAELVYELAKANVFLLFNDYSILGTKIYDYLALERKILLCYSDDAEAKKLKKKFFHLDDKSKLSKQLQQDLLTLTNAGNTVKDSDHLLSLLNELYNEFLTYGKIHCHSKNIDQFSRKKQAEKYAAIIKRVIA